MTEKKHSKTAGARKGARADSRLAGAGRLELPEGLHRQLTREALGDDGSVESFVMLLLVVEAALKAGDLVTARNLLFRSVTHAYETAATTLPP